MRVVSATLLGSVPVVFANLPIVEKAWWATFSKPGEDGDFAAPGEDGSLYAAMNMKEGEPVQEDGGLFPSAVDACSACVQSVVATKDCDTILSSSCFVINTSLEFASKTVETVEDDKIVTKKIESSNAGKFLYTINSPAGKADSYPAGGESCAEVMHTYHNEGLTDPQVKKACGRGFLLCSPKTTEFENTCTQVNPPETLCSTEPCCDFNMVQIGTTLFERKCACLEGADKPGNCPAE
jgi:hypothetical protein